MNDLIHTPPSEPAKREWEAPTIRQWDVNEVTQSGPTAGTADGFIYS
jgi:hypothetical protein